MLAETIAQGRVQVSPDVGVSGEFGTWTVSYTVGDGGIARNGGIRVQLPDTWHAGAKNSARRLQASRPAEENYISSTTTASGAKLETIVEGETTEPFPKSARISLDGRSERYVFVVRVRVVEGSLKAGDRIDVVYGDRSGGGLGMPAAAIATQPEPVLVALDRDGSNRFSLVRAEKGNEALIQSIAGDPVELQFHVPSNGVVGQPVRLLVVLLDRQKNPVQRAARVKLSRISGDAEFPGEIGIPEGRGFGIAVATPRAAGVMRLKASVVEHNFVAVSNPSDVTVTRPERSLYWGDLHSHSAYSWDGVGHQSYEYARHVSGLDFYALTDHGSDPGAAKKPTRGLSHADWPAYTALAERYNDEPYFVTLHGYECSFPTPWGHHNVYFRTQPGPLIYPTDGPLPELWQRLKSGDALTIPHHTGKMPQGVRFEPQDSERRRTIEIYSGHGLSEAGDRAHPLSFENSDFTSPGKSVTTPSFAQDAWARGIMLSTIASSDDHHSQPGQPQWGMAAIRAPSLTRNAIFQGLYDRHTYGTTGSKIILEFQVNDTPMGQIGVLHGTPTLRVRASGTDVIEVVEILKHQPPAKEFFIVKTWRPEVMDFVDDFRDDAFAPGAIYYVRLRQKNLVRGRVAMAWSSPIWTRQ